MLDSLVEGREGSVMADVPVKKEMKKEMRKVLFDCKMHYTKSLLCIKRNSTSLFPEDICQNISCITLAWLYPLKVLMTLPVKPRKRMKQKDLLHHTVVLLFLFIHTSAVNPTESPVSCFTTLLRTINCFWNPILEDHVVANYTLSVTEQRGHCVRDYGEPILCHPKKGELSCSVTVKNFYAEYKISLLASSISQQARMHSLCFSAAHVVKLDPPVIETVLPKSGRSDCLVIQWTNHNRIHLLDEVVCVIQFEEKDSKPRKTEKILQELPDDSAMFHEECELPPFSNYTIQMRIVSKSSIVYWSDWSKAVAAVTPEAAPSRGPAVWWKITGFDADGRRECIILWKPLKKNEANSRILKYKVYYKQDGKQSALPVCSTTEFQCAIVVPLESYSISVFALSTMGISPPTTITIPPASQKAALPLLHVTCSSTEDGLLVRWQPVYSQASTAYIIDWCEFFNENVCNNTRWQIEPGNVTQVHIKEGKECLKYTIRVSALQNHSVTEEHTTHYYWKQTAPRVGPEVRAEHIEKFRVQLAWDIIPDTLRCGFIQNYTLVVQHQQGSSFSYVVNSSVHHYTLLDLSPGSNITVHVMASTDGGSTSGPDIVIRTGDTDQDGKGLLLTLLGLMLFFLLVPVFLAFLYKKLFYRLRKHFLPHVPDPAKSSLCSWKPQNIHQGLSCIRSL
ncbi:granulocyte colony-stimulating factor receptor-like [Protopterus annectens]|uniref:granulocyte colony-stimulating factor receptor-like n=1 Tax=Protopterus annectens TaxID=7888 RepID=UPI001CF95E53|nr:granulocyte colony-stimulating factor receptor-like [Protopterus annectens]